MNRLVAIITTLCLATGALAQNETKREHGFTPGLSS